MAGRRGREGAESGVGLEGCRGEVEAGHGCQGDPHRAVVCGWGKGRGNRGPR